MSTEPAQAILPAAISANAFSSLFQAVNGLRNRRALVALIGCTVAGVLVAGLLVATSGTLGFMAGLLAFIVYFVAVGTGVNAAGLLHMDSARGISPRSTVDALVYGLVCIPKLIVLGLAFIAVEIAIFIVLAILFFICKIPFLGPLLFTVVFPVSVVVAGVTICGLFLCMVLSLPAIWQGATITRALAQTLAIARSRLIEAVLLLVFVGFLAFAVGLVIFGVLGAGLLPTLGLSGSIVGFGGGMGGMGSLMGMMQGYGGGSQMVAGAIGGLVLWAVAASLVGQVYLLGLCLVYLRVTEGLDPSATEAALRERLDDARRRAGELGEKARNTASRDGAAAAAAAGATAAAAMPMYPSAPVAGSVAPVDSAVPPAYTPPSASPYNAPPAFAPPPSFEPPAAFNPPPAYAPPHDFMAPAPPDSVDPDIALPFDDAPPAPAPAYAAAPAYVPPPVQPAAPVAPAPTAATTCPQCLSPVAADDLFCGVCGYRLK
jgi:hypothetical protein